MRAPSFESSRGPDAAMEIKTDAARDAADSRETELSAAESLSSEIDLVGSVLGEIFKVPVTSENADRFVAVAEIIGRFSQDVAAIPAADRGDMGDRVAAIANRWEKHLAESIFKLPPGSPERAHLEAAFTPPPPAPFSKSGDVRPASEH